VYELEAATDYVITVNPHHEAFYRKLLCFEPIGELVQCHKVEGAPGIPMRLNLLTLEETYRKKYGRCSGARNLHRVFFTDRRLEMSRRITRELEQREHLLTMGFLKEMFAERTTVLNSFDTYWTFFRQWSDISLMKERRHRAQTVDFGTSPSEPPGYAVNM
jgi:hypothetical protein